MRESKTPAAAGAAKLRGRKTSPSTRHKSPSELLRTASAALGSRSVSNTPVPGFVSLAFATAKTIHADKTPRPSAEAAESVLPRRGKAVYVPTASLSRSGSPWRSRRGVVRAEKKAQRVYGHYSAQDAWFEILRLNGEGRRRARLYTCVTWLSNTTVVLALATIALVLIDFDLTYEETLKGSQFFHAVTGEAFSSPASELVASGETSSYEDIDFQYPWTPLSTSLSWTAVVLSIALAVVNCVFHYFLYELLDRRNKRAIINTVLLAVVETILSLIIVPPFLSSVNVRYHSLDNTKLTSSQVRNACT